MAEKIQVNFYHTDRVSDGTRDYVVARMMDCVEAGLLQEGRSLRLEGLSSLVPPVLEAARLNGPLRIKGVGLAVGLEHQPDHPYLRNSSVSQMWVCVENA